MRCWFKAGWLVDIRIREESARVRVSPASSWITAWPTAWDAPVTTHTNPYYRSRFRVHKSADEVLALKQTTSTCQFSICAIWAEILGRVHFESRKQGDASQKVMVLKSAVARLIRYYFVGTCRLTSLLIFRNNKFELKYSGQELSRLGAGEPTNAQAAMTLARYRRLIA